MGNLSDTPALGGLQSISGWANSPGMPNSDPKSVGKGLMSPPPGTHAFSFLLFFFSFAFARRPPQFASRDLLQTVHYCHDYNTHG
jgi:hypothetical protein